MNWYGWPTAGVGVALLLWALGVLVLVLAGRRSEARALARFIPDCLLLFKRLLADPRVSRSRKAALALGVVYLALPIDLVPDFIPVAGQLDDAIAVALVLRFVLRAGGRPLLREHWSGPPESLRFVTSLAFGRTAA
jgi:uncharacterized membrane protein YkvA (DUF1232 family)